MNREGFNNLSENLTGDEIRKMADYSRSRKNAFVSAWTPDQVLVHRFAEVAEELLRLRNVEGK